MKEKEVSIKGVLRCSGAFVAWVIGSGFATGQEVLQFFTSYGYESYAIVAVNLIGFLIMGTVLLANGRSHKDDENFEQFTFYCGQKLGIFYSWLIPITLLAVMAVLISGAGATLNEYYGLNHYVGAAIMATAVLCAYFIGFDRMVKVLSFTGPTIIGFCLLIGIVTVLRDHGNFSQIAQYEEALSVSQSSSHWAISAILYISYNFLCGSVYYTQLGKTTKSVREACFGAILGAVLLMAAIAVINTAILLNGSDTSKLAIPNLFLAKEISWMLGAVFSIFLVMGIFSSCSAMMWTVCTKFTTGNIKKDRIAAVTIAIGTFILGLFPFGELIGMFYPIIGYCGLVYMGCVVIKMMKKKESIRGN